MLQPRTRWVLALLYLVLPDFMPGILLDDLVVLIYVAIKNHQERQNSTGPQRQPTAKNIAALSPAGHATRQITNRRNRH